ncbi:glycosyltransferase [Actinomycetospora atypica]|uniref:Glycosyltransferase n=1 Tax=Actinomycetospora atypica TaxID=1290095 RepID=A0ABV9YIR9_9PSEU
MSGQRHEGVDVDFSLAMHNRTGKYVIGRSLIDCDDLPVVRVLYWWSSRVPRGLVRRIFGRLQLWHIKSKTGTASGHERLAALIPRRRNMRPLLHLDPLTVATVRLRSDDIVVCHDIGPLTHPDLFEKDVGAMYRSIYDEIAQVGPHLVFVSRDVRDRFQQAYPEGRAASRRVIYPAIESKKVPHDGGVAPPSVGSRFLLTVGSIGARKNQRRCIEAYAYSSLPSQNVQYVICGGPEPGFEEVAAAADSVDGVVMLPHVPDGELDWLYSNAQGFVLVSRLEGFGMPVAEAIEYGLVPLVTRHSVLEEVAGADAFTADAEDVSDIQRGMEKLAALTVEERQMRSLGLRTYGQRFRKEEVLRQWRNAFSAWTA